jgi:hypothetical protein
MPAVKHLVANRCHDACRLSGLEDDDHLIRLGPLEVGLDKFVAPALGRLDNRSVPLIGMLLHPVLKLLGSASQDIAADRVDVPIGIEKADDLLGR